MHTKRVTPRKPQATGILADIEPILTGIARGERALAEGHAATHAQARKRLAKWLK